MNKIILVLVLMLLGHLLADYPLQGWLAQAKAKSYWENSPQKNRHDYIAALLGHSVMWGIIVFLPIIWVTQGKLDWWWFLLLGNIIYHYLIDDMKANHKTINLWQDQLYHLSQIILTWSIWGLFINK